MTDYYNVLGIKKDCTNTEIRSAYKKLAFKWHPDKNAQNKELANTKFKEISEAYKILGDKKKRKIYNQYGIENYENDYTFNSRNTNVYNNNMMKDLFNNINKTVNENLFKKDLKSSNITYNLICSIEELYTGCEKKIKIKRKIFDINKKIIRTELEIFKVNIIPGWKNGTKITYKNKADIYINMKQGDVIITIKEKKNKNLIRKKIILYLIKI
jgi:DnaJ homolog subfamily B member 4